MSACTASGRASRLAYSRVLRLNARISSGTRGSSLRSAATKPRCQSAARSRTKRLGCPRRPSPPAAARVRPRRRCCDRPAGRSRRARAPARPASAPRLHRGPGRSSSTRRATTSPAAAVSGRPRVSDQTRCARASSSRIPAHALRLGCELVLPAAERGRGALELVSHIRDGAERGLLRDRGARPREQCVEIGAQRRRSLPRSAAGPPLPPRRVAPRPAGRATRRPGRAPLPGGSIHPPRCLRWAAPTGHAPCPWTMPNARRHTGSQPCGQGLFQNGD